MAPRLVVTCFTFTDIFPSRCPRSFTIPPSPMILQHNRTKLLIPAMATDRLRTEFIPSPTRHLERWSVIPDLSLVFHVPSTYPFASFFSTLFRPSPSSANTSSTFSSVFCPINYTGRRKKKGLAKEISSSSKEQVLLNAKVFRDYFSKINFRVIIFIYNGKDTQFIVFVSWNWNSGVKFQL